MDPTINKRARVSFITTDIFIMEILELTQKGYPLYSR